jgi:hypothetical protein
MLESSYGDFYIPATGEIEHRLSNVIEVPQLVLQLRMGSIAGWSGYLETAARAQQAADKALLGSGGEASSVEAADREWITYLNAKYSDWNK